jgi:hypothetical protein
MIKKFKFVNKKGMKNIFAIAVLSLVFFSCAVKVPYTRQVNEEFGLKSEEKMRKVQFFTSSTIILNQIAEASSETTTDQSGTLVSSSTSESESLIIPANTRCIFEGYGANGELRVRFETGDQKYLQFMSKGNQLRDRHYFVANWKANGGPRVQYGGKTYKVDMMRGASRSAYIKVSKKRLQSNKRKERVVKGMKV